MKIVQINAVYESSSTGRIVMEIHDTIRDTAHESWVFCSDKAQPGNNIFRIGGTSGHKLHALNSRLWGLQGYFSAGATKGLISRLKIIKPDVVHLHNLHANFINFPILLDFLAKEDIPTVVTIHDCWFFTGHCCHYIEDKCDRWQTGCGDCPALHKYNNSWFFDRSRKIFNDKKRLFSNIPRLAIIGNSDWTTNQAKKSLLKEAKIIERIYNWIDLDIFYPRDKMIAREKLGIGKNDFVIIGVAQSWSEKKGLSVFIEIAKKHLTSKVIIIGEIKDKDGLPDNVMAIGTTSNATELAEYYSAADVFVNTSIQETFGKVSAEALACGVPIITNNLTANPELAGKGCGYIAEDNSTETYCELIENVRTKGREYFFDTCRNFAKQNFDMRQNINSYINMYKKIQ